VENLVPSKEPRRDPRRPVRVHILVLRETLAEYRT